MYTIIGGDGKEYGPVAAELVRSWIAGGRANLQTRIKVAGSDEWKTIADFPELTAPASAVPMAAAATIGAAAPLDVFGCYARSWKLLTANFWPLVGVSILILFLLSLVGYTQFVGIFFISPLLGGIISSGLYYYFLKTIRGQPTTIGDAFAGFTKAFVTLLVIDFLIMIFVTVGFFCLILPGIYLVIAYTFSYLLAVDKGLGIWESMETSRKVITRQWFRMFGLILLAIPFMLLGVIALGIGIFVTIPLVTGAFIYAYEDLTGPKA
jgi:hypothetical protein